MWYFNPHTRSITWYPGGFTPPAPWKGPFKTKAGAQAYAKRGGKTKGKPGPKPKRQGGPSGAEIVAVARSWLGVPYLYGGTTRRGVDCSGLVQQVAFAVGIRSCPRTSEEQWAWCHHITSQDAGPGDLVFFVGAEIDPPPGHVGILVAPGLMINAPSTGMTVSYAHFADGPGINRIIGYGRMVGAMKSTTANNNYKTREVQRAGGTAVAAGAGAVVVEGASIFLMIAMLVVLVGAGLLFKGMM